MKKYIIYDFIQKNKFKISQNIETKKFDENFKWFGILLKYQIMNEIKSTWFKNLIKTLLLWMKLKYIDFWIAF